MNATTYFCRIYNANYTIIDELRCQILKTAADLFYYDFGYYCMGPLFLIIIISIFGKLKGHYRWFILNQAIWDVFASSRYSCDSLMSGWVKTPTPCFYLTNNKSHYSYFQFDGFIRGVITHNSYSALLLLTTSRFMALYYPHAYAKLIKGRKILYTIIAFNFFAILFDIYVLFWFFQTNRMSELVDDCVLQLNKTRTICASSFTNKDYEKDSLYRVYTNFYYGFELLHHFKPPLFLFLSMILTILIIWKMVKQIFFQVKQNQKNFSNTVRIVVVISLQNVINCFGVFLETFNQFIPRFISVFSLKILIARNAGIGKEYPGYWDLRLPLWIDGIYGLTSDTCRPMIIQFRILIESLVVLFIMTGYREAIISFIKYFYQHMKSPKKFLKNFKFISSKTTVSNPSLF